MTRTEFETAAQAQRPVRLGCRSFCYYKNEWYLPMVTADGELYIDSNQERRIRVDEGILNDLQEQNGRTTSVRELIEKLRTLDPDDRPVVRGISGGYNEVAIDHVTAITIAVEAGVGHKGADTHGPATDAPGAYDPEERAVVIGGGPQN